MNQPKVPLLFNLATANREEPPIQNEEFLRSYHQVGVSIRIVTAYQQHKLIQDPKLASLERFAAVTTLYQTLGMIYEDIAASAVAWAAWAKNRSLLLADIYQRTFLTSKPETTAAGRQYHEERAELFSTTTKTVRTCSQQFFESLDQLNGEQLLNTLGIPWKQYPSVKLVPENRRQEWQVLPEYTKELLRPLADKKSLLLNTSYNKLKHGPQIVVMNPYRTALEKRGVTEVPAQQRALADNSYIRLLFDGARTQEIPGELQDGDRVAPFLIHQPEVIEGVLIQLVTVANMMRLLAWWLYRCEFKVLLPDSPDPIIVEIATRFRDRLRAQFGVL